MHSVKYAMGTHKHVPSRPSPRGFECPLQALSWPDT